MQFQALSSGKSTEHNLFCFQTDTKVAKKLDGRQTLEQTFLQNCDTSKQRLWRDLNVTIGSKYSAETPSAPHMSCGSDCHIASDSGESKKPMSSTVSRRSLLRLRLTKVAAFFRNCFTFP